MQHFISSYGYLAILLLMTAESACIPVPYELTMPFGGAIAAGAVAGAHLNLALVIAVGVAGNVIGSYLAWAAGWYGVDSVLVRSDRSRRHVAHAHEWFDRYGAPTVFLSRMVPVVRTFISLPAGIARMPLLQFSIYTAAGSFIWCLLLTVLGDQAGSNWGEWHRRIGYLNYVVVLVAAALLVAWLLRRRRRTQV